MIGITSGGFMKSKFCIFCLLLLFTITLTAQTVHEPNSGIYRDIDTWIIKGYIKSFPPLIRPYPAQLVINLLNEVVENGDTAARQTALNYLNAVSPESRLLNPGLLGYVQGNEDDYSLIAGGFLEGLFHISEALNVSFNFTLYGISDNHGERFNVPGTYSPYPDFVLDTSNIGSIQLMQEWTSITAVGTSDIYLQAGLTRTSVGPFYDNGIIAGPQAPRHGHFSFVYYQLNWTFEILLQAITATNDFGKKTVTNKFNILHNIVFRPIDNFEFGFHQSMVFGERMEFLYLIPFSFLFASESIYGFSDNALMGLHFRWRPFNNFLVNGQVYVDDFHFNNILKGIFQAKIAGEIGVSWAPESKYLSRLDFDYTAVFPYTYSHWSLPEVDRYTDAAVNYLNYTHMGRNIGPDLEPNSDRISLRTYWNIIPSVKLNFSAYFIRHANASENRKDAYYSDNNEENYRDGSVYDDGLFRDPSQDRGSPFLPGFADFLTQDLIEMYLGGTLGVYWTLPVNFGTFVFSLDYGVEYGWNRKFEKWIIKDNNGFNHYWSIGAAFHW